jgi:hypothetical protein
MRIIQFMTFAWMSSCSLALYLEAIIFASVSTCIDDDFELLTQKKQIRLSGNGKQQCSVKAYLDERANYNTYKRRCACFVTFQTTDSNANRPASLKFISASKGRGMERERERERERCEFACQCSLALLCLMTNTWFSDATHLASDEFFRVRDCELIRVRIGKLFTSPFDEE